MTLVTGATVYGYLGSQMDTMSNTAGTTSYRYLAGSGLLSVLDPPLGPATDAVNYTWDNYGRLSSRKDPTGITTCFTYASDGQKVASKSLVSGTCAVPGTTKASFAITYDKAANPTQVAQFAPGYVTADGGAAASANHWTFNYDAAGRMYSATDPGGGGTTYAYDGAGNLCWKAPVSSGSAPSCSTPASGATIYGYDTAGFLRLIHDRHRNDHLLDQRPGPAHEFPGRLRSGQHLHLRPLG